MIRIINYIGNPANWPKLRRIFLIVLVLVFVSDFLVERHHAEYLWDKTPGWSAFYGFASCIVLVIVVKFFGHVWLYKKEDYYD